MLFDQKFNAVSILRLRLFCIHSNDAAKLQPNTVESAQDQIDDGHLIIK